MKRIFLLALAILTCNIAMAQIKVTGRVTSSDNGSPIPFANVVVKGTMTGVATLDDGTYVIDNVPGNAVLVFSSIGFLNTEIQVGNKRVIDIALKPDSEALEEVMVVAYGTVKKGSYSGSAAVVKESAIKDAPVVSFEQVLAGKAPGVQVASYSGQPGSEVQINIRGFGSFNAGNQPLYVIDGVPATSGDWASGNISTSSMNFLNPSDVESITILKDAAAASLYGSRASNGVILITTKKGKEGRMTSTFKANAGFSYFAYNNYPLATDAQAEQLHREAWYNYGTDNPSLWKKYGSLDAYVAAKVEENYPSRDESKYIYKDWEDVLFRTGIAQNYEYSISGGTDKSKIYASIGYTDQQGVVKIDYLRRFSTTLNVDFNVNKRLKVGGSVQYSWQYQDGHQDGWASKDNPFFIWKVVLTERWPYAYKSDGSIYNEPMNPNFSTINPVSFYDQQVNDAWQNRLILKGWAEFAFTDYLKVKSIVNSDWLYVHDRFGWLYGHPNFYAYSDIGGYMSDRHRNINRMVSSTTLNFNKSFGDHNIGAMAGWEAEKENYSYTRVAKIDFSYMGATESIFGTNFDDGYTYTRDDRLLSFLSSLNYDYASKYYLTGTYRRDGSSRLAPQNRWGNFWSVSGSWRFSNEDFMQFEWLNDAKLRASYGTSGTLPSSYFGYMSVYDYSQYGEEGASYPSNLANSDLTWEKNKNWNIGLDATIFDRVTIAAEYFNRKTTDLLLDASVPSTTGFSSTLMNIGSMANTGFEFSINVDIIKKQDLNLSFGFNWATLHNEVLSLSEDGESIVDTPYVWQKGYSFYQYRTRAYLGINPETGKPQYAEGSFYEAGEKVDQDVILKDGTVIPEGGTMPKDGYNYTPTTRQNASNIILEGQTAIPKGYGGFNVDFGWKNWSIAMAWSYKYGHYIWDEGTEQLANDGYRQYGQNIWASQVDTWSETNTNASVPRRVVGNNQGGYYYSSRYLKKGDFLRLKNLSVSYNLPKNFSRKINIQNARLYVAGTNLLTFSGLDIDPEMQASGYYYYTMPSMRTVTIGLELTL
ncbi:MAG: TonB-dependent receptor [Bacteroidales bacterium]|nr:TonB-dependent receptor [Bacteroidales bacterium]MDD4669582.1 TonB-dependent receptor [Bacteroidales bacterium]